MLFSLISTPRSGTTAFRSLLNQNSDVYLFGEVLYPDYFSWGFFSWLAAKRAAGKHLDLPHTWTSEYIPYLHNIAGIMFEAGKKSVGVDLKWGQVKAIFGLDKLIARDELGIIHLVRRNTAATVLSQIRMAIALSTGRPIHLSAHAKNKEKLDITVEIKGYRLQNLIDELRVEESIIEQTYSSGAYIKIYYEDIFGGGDLNGVSQKLSKFLDASVDLGGEIKFQKIGTDNVFESVVTDDLGLEILANYMS